MVIDHEACASWNVCTAHTVSPLSLGLACAHGKQECDLRVALQGLLAISRVVLRPQPTQDEGVPPSSASKRIRTADTVLAAELCEVRLWRAVALCILATATTKPVDLATVVPIAFSVESRSSIAEMLQATAVAFVCVASDVVLPSVITASQRLSSFPVTLKSAGFEWLVCSMVIAVFDACLRERLRMILEYVVPEGAGLP
jgi:hypothetical protein